MALEYDNPQLATFEDMNVKAPVDYAYDNFLGMGKQARARRAMKLEVKRAKKMAKVEIKLARAQRIRDTGQSKIMKEEARNVLAEQGQSMGAGGALGEIAKGIFNKGDAAGEAGAAAATDANGNPVQPKKKNVMVYIGIGVAVIVVLVVVFKMMKKK